MKGSWSTRELADLAGTTLKTVRYYHRIGLLAEPDRAANGYKQYRITHLIRLLRIRRLVDLGVSPAGIAAMDASEEGAEQTLRALDAELAAGIARQQRMREDLALVLQHRHLAEVPPGFEVAADDLPPADRAFLLIAARTFAPGVLDELREQYTVPRTALGREFDDLPADADEPTRTSLAARYAPEVHRDWQRYPRLVEEMEQVAAGHDPVAQPVVLHAVNELYNPAQIDVLQRIHALLRG